MPLIEHATPKVTVTNARGFAMAVAPFIWAKACDARVPISLALREQLHAGRSHQAGHWELGTDRA